MTAHPVFEQKAPIFMSWLIRDFHFTPEQAAGIVGNIGHESGGFTQLREIGKPSGRGGYGYCQWTGPRAHTFLNYCHAHKLDWRSDLGNYYYLKDELSKQYAYLLAHLKETDSVAGATECFERYYERAGIPAMSSRIQWANLALAAYHGVHKHG